MSEDVVDRSDANDSGVDPSGTRLQFSDDGIPTVVEMVENEMVLDHRTLVEFLSKAGGSYTATIQGDDGIQPGTLLQISPNTILAVAAVGRAPTDEELIEAASSIILPSEDEGVLQEAEVAGASTRLVASAAVADAEQADRDPSSSVGVHVVQENMSEVDFSSFLCENENGDTSTAASAAEQQDQQQEVDVEGDQHCSDDRQMEQAHEEQEEEVVDATGHSVTDVIQRALLENVEEGEDDASNDDSNSGQPNHEGLAQEPVTDETLQEENQQAQEEEQQDVVVIDVTNPIQLSQNSLIVVNGQKCVLQQDPGTGQVVAYPVKEPEKPKRRRGRPRKVQTQEDGAESKVAPQPPPEEEEEEEEDGLHKLGNGMVDIVTEDGALVRRSCRKRKKVKNMKDFETNLKLNDESDDVPEEEEEPYDEAELDAAPRKRGRGRPPRRGSHHGADLFYPFTRNQRGVRRKRGRPRRSGPRRPLMQAFLVQMADGQTLMMQIPTASLPAGADLREVAQSIAGSLNAAAPQALPSVTTTDEPALAATGTEMGSNEHQPEVETPSLANGQQCLQLQQQQQLLQLDSILTPQSVVLPMEGEAVGSVLVAPHPIALTEDVPAPAKRHLGRPRKRWPDAPQGVSQLLLQSDAVPSSSAAGNEEPLAISGDAQDTTEALLTSDETTDMKQRSSVDVTKSSMPSTLADAVAQVLGPDDDEGIQEQQCETPAGPTEDAVVADEGRAAEQTQADEGTEGSAENQQETSVDQSDLVVGTVGNPSAGSTMVIPVPDKLVPLLMPLPKIGLKSTDADLQKLQCSICKFQAFYPKQYRDHISTHKDAVRKCKCCSFVCLEEEELYDHYKDQHPRCICPYCNHTAEQSYIMKRHMFRHIESGCKCDICGKQYKDQYILKMHVKMVHMPADVLFECSVCSKKFTRKAHLKRHIRTHNPDKPYKCHLCSYRGCERSDITKHMLIHEEPKHACDICGRSFRHIKNKDLHLKRHKGQKDYKCGVCEFYGYTFTDIRKHIERKHSDPQTILCDRCGQAFKTQALMKEHQMSTQCEVYMIEQELTEYDPPVVQLTESAEEGADGQPVTSDNEDQEVATIELTDESLATLTGMGECQQLYIRKVEGVEGQYAIVTTKEDGEQEVTYVSEEALAMQIPKDGNSVAEGKEIAVHRVDDQDKTTLADTRNGICEVEELALS